MIHPWLRHKDAQCWTDAMPTAGASWIQVSFLNIFTISNIFREKNANRHRFKHPLNLLSHNTSDGSCHYDPIKPQFVTQFKIHPVY